METARAQIAWHWLFLSCLTFIALSVPLIQTVLIALSSRLSGPNPINQYLALLLYGSFRALINALLITAALFIAKRRAPVWLDSLSHTRMIGFGLLLGFAIGFIQLVPDLVIIYGQGNPWPGGTLAVLHDLMGRFLVHLIPIGICTAIFSRWAVERLRPNHRVQPTPASGRG